MSFYTFLPKLLNMSLTGAVAVICVLLLRLMLKKAPKVISYALWAVVLFRLLCPVSVTSGLSLFGLLDAPSTSTVAGTNSMEYIPENIVQMELSDVTTPAPGVSNTMNDTLPPGVSNTLNDTLPQGQEQLAADSLKAPVAIGSHVSIGSYVTIGTYVWLLGVMAMAAYSISSYIRLRKKLLMVSPLQDNIRLADEITTPFVMGLIRPKIYLPSDTEEHQMPYLILHEKHHIRRGDHIFKALAFLALSIHWFNPLVWVAFIYASRDMEMSCDEAVVKKLGEQILPDYTASLLSLATGKIIIAGVPLAFGEGDTKGRIRNLAHWKKPAFWVVIAAVAACVILGVGLLTNPVKEDTSEFSEDRYYFLIGAEGVTSIEVSTLYSSGGVINANGSAFKSGEKVWLEQLQGVRDLRGITITAFGTDGNILHRFSVPEDASSEVIAEMVENDSWLLVPTDFEVFLDKESAEESVPVSDVTDMTVSEIPEGDEPLTGILGFDDCRVRVEESTPGFFIRHYYAEREGKQACIAEQFGYFVSGAEPEAYSIDLDGDTVPELVCNVAYGTGAERVIVYRNNGGIVEQGTIAQSYHEDTFGEDAWCDGISCIGEKYDPVEGAFVVTKYISDGSIKTASFKGLDNFIFLPYDLHEANS